MTNLKINKSGFKLKKCNFIKEATSKDRIVIGNTYSEDMNHFIGWELRFGGAYKKTSMFTVRLDGTIYQHFSPNYYSEVFENTSAILFPSMLWASMPYAGPFTVKLSKLNCSLEGVDNPHWLFSTTNNTGKLQTEATFKAS